MPTATDYPYLLTHTPWRGWCLAAAAAAALNLALFLLMPQLLHQSPAPQQYDAITPQVQMIRLKRPERPTERPKPIEPQQKPIRRPQPTTAPDTAVQRPRWPFEISDRLPAGPGSVVLPPIETNFTANLQLGDLFGIGDLDRPLVALTRMPPVYPLGAKRKGVEGWVSVRFIVNEKGSVEEITILDARPEGVFETSVKRCVAGWRFQPGTVEGEPVRVWAETTIRFELE